MMSTPLIFFFLLLYARRSTAVGFLDSEGDDLITELGEGTNVVAGYGADDLIIAQKAEEGADEITRVKRAAAYQVPTVSIRQDGESRIVSWKEASGPLPVTKYNIYRTFTTDIPFDVTLLKPIATISSSEPRPFKWKDTCRTEQVSVRYAVTAVDIAGTEHTSDVVVSNLLPLVGSFVSTTPIKYPVHTVGGCCAIHHSMVFNPDLSQFLLVYACDYDDDGNGDDVFMVFLDYAGNSISPARSIKVSVSGSSVQERPSVAYNPQLKQYLVAFHLRTASIHRNKQVVVTRVIQTAPRLAIDRPRLSLTGSLANGQATDLRRSSLIYNPVTNGYVVSAELVLTGSVQIIFAHLVDNGQAKSSGTVFAFHPADVVQPTLVYDPQTETIVFVSQLDNSHPALSRYNGKHGIILKSIPVSANSAAGRRPHVISATRVKESAISIHRENATGCLRVCFLIDKNNNNLTETTCSKICASGSDDWVVNSDDVLFCTCKEKAVNPHVIEYPVSGSIFGVWEETDQTRHRLHGYFVSTQNFVQTPLSAIQKHPLATYRSSDGQVCVVWQHHSSSNTCKKLAFRCFELSRRCNDPCCCLLGDHCDACGFQVCDSNADCTLEKQCSCRNSLGFSGNGTSCRFEPCTPGFHSCQRDVDCMVRGKSFICSRGVSRKKLDNAFGDGSRGPCAPGVHDCHINATCYITPDLNYTCSCKGGHFGDGKLCLDRSVCHPDASRLDDGKCLCKRGFVGNGLFCCPTNFGDQEVALGSSLTLHFNTTCLGPHVRFTVSFQWYFRSLPINVSSDSSYKLRKGYKDLVIRNIKKRQLGQYAVRFSVEGHGPYKVAARVDLLQTGGTCACGLSGLKEERIAKLGVEAKAGEFPWQAMLCNKKGRVFCGGVMISKCCILTAAHCVISFNASNSNSLKVCLGRRSGDCNVGLYDNETEQQNERVQCFDADRILVHQGYNKETFEHDIAMIQPKRSKCLKCRAASVKPVCLPKSKRDNNYLTSGTTAWITGWGEIQQNSGTSSALRKGKTTLVGRGKCKTSFAQQGKYLPHDQICADDEVGPCQGDSGGPLMVRNRQFDSRYVLVGLVSWGDGCGVRNSYGAYAGIVQNLDWIYDSCSRWN